MSRCTQSTLDNFDGDPKRLSRGGGSENAVWSTENGLNLRAWDRLCV